MLNNACKYTQSTPLTACVSGVLCNMRTPPKIYDGTDKKAPTHVEGSFTYLKPYITQSTANLMNCIQYLCLASFRRHLRALYITRQQTLPNTHLASNGRNV